MPYDELKRDSGRVLRGQHVALYRDAGGELHAISSICTHRGCDVGWNDEDKIWDCPCHGSRFAPDGAVIRGPAEKPLLPADTPS